MPLDFELRGQFRRVGDQAIAVKAGRTCDTKGGYVHFLHPTSFQTGNAQSCRLGPAGKISPYRFPPIGQMCANVVMDSQFEVPCIDTNQQAGFSWYPHQPNT